MRASMQRTFSPPDRTRAGLRCFFSGEEHAAQPAADIAFILALGELTQPVDQVVLAVVEVSAVVLGKIALAGGHAPLEAALIRLHFAHEDLEERGARQLVRADEGNLVARGQHKGDVVEHLAPVDRLEKVGHGQQVVADLAIRLPRDIRITAGRRRKVLHLKVVEQLLTAGRLLMLAGVGREALNKRLQFLDLLLVLLVDILLLTGCHLGIFIPEIVVADVHLNLAEVDIADMCADLIEEVAVMADDDYRIREIQQEVFQPADGLDIQIVGRFVQQQDIRHFRTAPAPAAP